MPTRTGKPYLVRESNESHTTPMDPQLVATLANIMAQLNTVTQTVNQTRDTINERLTNLETTREQPTMSSLYCSHIPCVTPKIMLKIMH